MISTTLSGLVFPAFTPRQRVQYQLNPVGYTHDLSAAHLSPEYSKAVVEHVGEVAQRGRDFVEDVVAMSSWYQPAKGGNVDTWA
jgi:hypothetical protein